MLCFEVNKRTRSDLNRRPNAPQLFSFQENDIAFSKGAAPFGGGFRKQVREIDWADYEKWCFNNKSERYAKFLVRGGKRWASLAFSNELVDFPKNRTKEDILKAITNLTRYLDIRNDSSFHEEFIYWLKRKEIRWKAPAPMSIPKQITIDEIFKNIKNLPEKYRIFAIFSLVSGLRTFESVKVLNNHSELCKDGIIRMYWDRITKKSTEVYCHPHLHKKLNFKYSEHSIHRNLTTKMLGCQIKYLRKLNYTINATKIDMSMAEFWQGRSGNISQKHYFLPLMDNYRKKWIKVWDKILLQNL